eukprot:CAMPEP_0181116760 /NCGR_PEP_ID=MMETSP1071-20121207/22128_1 /TAXON_ID=35127 /ORGANISM="Thalassiosira sp., Strain NH16" /LENGTH=374 /DNA_ID=CAMNT_0023201037 /DNA_START=202 /DNA_END=1326 /DNA_ORIENTATION=-
MEGMSESAAAAGRQGDKVAASASRPMFDASRLGWYAAVLVPTAFIGWGILDEESPPAKLSRMVGLTDKIEEFSKPAREKLLLDWDQMPNVPKDADFRPPPVLVVDLESTLVCSSWDRKYGWRHAKRPGVDKFLAALSQYYEIVIWTPSPDSLALPVLESLNSKGHVMHFLFRDSTNYHDGVHCKDLSWLNRPMRKIIALDDDSAALQFQPENLIRVKPYDDPNDREDKTLERIIPLLVEVSLYDNIPEILLQFQGMDADEIADEHERRVNDLRARRDQIAQRGLASFASSRSSLPPPELPPSLTGSGDGQPQQLTAKDLVGSAPPTEASESGVIGWLQRRGKQKKEQDEEKFGLWNEVMTKKRAEKKKKMEGAQ